MVSALDFPSGGRRFEPGLSLPSCCFLRQETLFHIVYKWVPAIIMLGGNLAMN